MNREFEQEVTQLHAEVCAALADPTRILIIYELAERPKNVTELAFDLNAPQSTVSRHLKVLRERGMVATVRRAQSVEYHLADRHLIDALDLLRGVMRDHIASRAGLMEQMEESLVR